MNHRRYTDLLIILAAGLFIYGYALGDAPLDRTEPHRALVAHEMVQSGDWVIPRLLGEVYLRKPPLIYWVEAVAEKIAGHGDELVWRLPSAIGSALLAVFLAWWSGRWFGDFARLAAGIGCLAIVAVWEQDRGADIDALNTLASVITACIILEILYGPTRRGWLWTIWLSISMGATLLLKGPSGLTAVLGALLGPSILLRDWKWMRRPGIWIGFVAGIAMFAVYAVIAKHRISAEHLPTDTAGMKEGLQRLVLHRAGDVLPAIAAAGKTLVYSLPVGLVIPFAFLLISKSPKEDITRRRMLAVLGTFAAALVIWVLSGNKNERYEYVTLPLLAPLVGAVAVGWNEDKFSPASRRALEFTFAAVGVMFVVAHLLITKKIWHTTWDIVIIALAAVCSIAAGVYMIPGWFTRKLWVSGYGILVLIVLLSVPVGDRKNIERRDYSAKNAAMELRDFIGAGSTIGVCSMVRDQPELFYYAGVKVQAFGEQKQSALAAAPGGRWVLLTQNDRFPEYSTIKRDIPHAFPYGGRWLKMPKSKAGEGIFVAWYDPPAGESKVTHDLTTGVSSNNADE
jgi:4-amino-4-deoxy-L-arabinose transferase-like glycosyltransferase